jgi:hypothetical protein
LHICKKLAITEKPLFIPHLKEKLPPMKRRAFLGQVEETACNEEYRLPTTNRRDFLQRVGEASVHD